MSMKAQILFLFSIYCFLIGSTPVMKAQTGKFYSTDKELSNSLINAVYQDRKGFIWIATENGLNKFDWEARPSAPPTAETAPETYDAEKGCA